MTHRLTLIVLCAVAAVVAACGGSNQTTARTDSTGTAKATGAATSVTGTRIAAPRTTAAGEWQMPAGDYASSRFSDLSQITPANAPNLRASWTFSTVSASVRSERRGIIFGSRPSTCDDCSAFSQ